MGYGGDKITIMVLKVDLQCCSCYKKVKNILCKFPQIRNQVYDEKNNTVTIAVVCCDPEKLRDKLCSKGCGVIKSIEIKEPEKQKEVEKLKIEVEKLKQNEVEKLKQNEVEKLKQKEVDKLKQKEVEKLKIEVEKLKQKEDEKSKTKVSPARGYCCGQCYEGHTGGPCYQLYGRLVPQPPYYHYCGCSYGPCSCGRGCYVSRCDQYVFSDENATGCSIM